MSEWMGRAVLVCSVEVGGMGEWMKNEVYASYVDGESVVGRRLIAALLRHTAAYKSLRGTVL